MMVIIREETKSSREETSHDGVRYKTVSATHTDLLTLGKDIGGLPIHHDQLPPLSAGCLKLSSSDVGVAQDGVVQLLTVTIL